MYLKRGLIYLVVFLILIISVNPTRISEERRGTTGTTATAPLTCSDGTLFGECNSEALLCAGINLLVEARFTNLNRDVQYLFFAEPIEPCQNPVLQLGSRRITLTNTGRKIVAQFTSQGEQLNIRTFCDGAEKNIEKKYLGVVYTQPNYDVRLHRDPLICETETELMELCVSTCNIDFCNDIKSSASKSIALEQYAVNCNEPSVCPQGLCVQKVIAFNCPMGAACDEFASYGVNPNFLNGKTIYIKDNTHRELKRYKFSGDNSNTRKCDISIEEQHPTGWGWAGSYIFKTTVDYGIIINKGNQNSFSNYFNEEPMDRGDSCRASDGSVSFCEKVMYQPFGTTLDYKKDCLEVNCKILRKTPDGSPQQDGQHPEIGPRADLLCGYDDKWHLCDRDGIKTFDNGKKYLCDGASGTWAELS